MGEKKWILARYPDIKGPGREACLNLDMTGVV